MLKVQNLEKVFNEGTLDEHQVLKGVDLTVEDGEFVAILGNNGAGKSTLLNCISGTYFIDGGQVLLDDKDVTYLPEHKRARYIGRLFQDPLLGTAPHMSIEENLSLSYLRAKEKKSGLSFVSKKERQLFYEKLKAMGMGLEERMKTAVGQLSGGQRQALTLLMATIVTPRLLLLDEHTAALDPKAAERIMELTVQAVKDNHIACLMVTHNMRTALSVADRIIMMQDGRIVSDIVNTHSLSEEDLLKQFEEGSGKMIVDDRILLQNA